jgi:hypothetical protein
LFKLITASLSGIKSLVKYQIRFGSVLSSSSRPNELWRRFARVTLQRAFEKLFLSMICKQDLGDGKFGLIVCEPEM